MKMIICLLTATLLHFSAAHASPATTKNVYAVTYAVKPGAKPLPLQAFTKLSTKQIAFALGRKLTFKEKVALKFLKLIHHTAPEPGENVRTRRGNTAFVLGIVAVGSLFIFPLAMLPCGILAVVNGNKAKRENANDRQAKTGVILGWIAIALFAFVVALIAIVIAGLTI